MVEHKKVLSIYSPASRIQASSKENTMSGYLGERNWLVYLLRCSDGTFYCGATNNLERRLSKHNSGKGARYTRARLPVYLEAQSGLMYKSQALILEYAVKQKKREEKVDFLRFGNS